MDEARLRPHDFCEMGEEGDDIMLGDGFDLIDAGSVEYRILAFGPDRFGGGLRDDAEFGHAVRRMGFDFKPDFVAGFRGPDLGHFRTAVAGDHGAAITNETEPREGENYSNNSRGTAMNLRSDPSNPLV